MFLKELLGKVVSHPTNPIELKLSEDGKLLLRKTDGQKWVSISPYGYITLDMLIDDKWKEIVEEIKVEKKEIKEGK